jgi:hypothetical protein
VRLKNQPASTIPGGWTYVAGFDTEVGEWVPASDPPSYEPIPPAFLVLAEEEKGFDDKAATITAHRTQYRHVTYLLDDEAAVDTSSLSAPPAISKRTDDRSPLLRKAWIKLGRPERAAEEVWRQAKADNLDKDLYFRSVATPRARRRIVAAAIKGAPLKNE